MVSLIRSQGSSLRALVDLEKGTIDRSIYISEDIYKQELEQVFGRAWLFIGHESQIPNVGDFVVSRMGEEEVILTRDRQNKIHVFLNTCRHRGMKVCRYDDGNALVFTCPFHGWSYDTDGRLVGVPYSEAAYQNELDKSQWGLHEVGQMCNYYGSIWATWDKSAPGFEDYLGAFAPTVRRCFEASDGTDNGIELFNPVYKWYIPCNWKFPSFSFDGDPYHAAMTHRSINVAAIGPDGDANGGSRHPVTAPFPSTSVNLSIPELGHSGNGALYHQPGMRDYVDTWSTEPAVDEYYRETRKKRQAKYKDEYIVGTTCLVWPNVNIQPQRILLWHPHGVGTVESWRLYPIDKAAPQIVKDAERRYMMRYGGPLGLTESDDMENWNYAHMASKGTEAAKLPYNFQQSINHMYEDPEAAPGFTIAYPGETGQRGRLNRWLDFMEADSWNDLYPIAPLKKNQKF
jgi:phenylpropionate dioxygenase-like ring-hydroxylating dioxygenase large terminal subunit